MHRLLNKPPDLVLRRPSQMDIKRIVQSSPEKIKYFFEELQKILQKNGYFEGLIINLDETGCLTKKEIEQKLLQVESILSLQNC
jgi:hypothetical protein